VLNDFIYNFVIWFRIPIVLFNCIKDLFSILCRSTKISVQGVAQLEMDFLPSIYSCLKQILNIKTVNSRSFLHKNGMIVPPPAT
jgi:hypothetical protein